MKSINNCTHTTVMPTELHYNGSHLAPMIMTCIEKIYTRTPVSVTQRQLNWAKGQPSLNPLDSTSLVFVNTSGIPPFEQTFFSQITLSRKSKKKSCLSIFVISCIVISIIILIIIRSICLIKNFLATQALRKEILAIKKIHSKNATFLTFVPPSTLIPRKNFKMTEKQKHLLVNCAIEKISTALKKRALLQILPFTTALLFLISLLPLFIGIGLYCFNPSLIAVGSSFLSLPIIFILSGSFIASVSLISHIVLAILGYYKTIHNITRRDIRETVICLAVAQEGISVKKELLNQLSFNASNVKIFSLLFQPSIYDTV